jgi:hypothetical protein
VSDFKLVSILNPSAVILTAGPAISAGTSSQATGTIAFANSNGVTFGLSNGTITASAVGGGGGGGITNINISAGTTSNNLSNMVFSNSNGMSFGLNGSTITGSYTVPPSQTTQTQPAGNIAGVGYTSTTQAGTTVGATHNTAGLSMAWPPFITTYAQSVQTQASGAIAGTGFTSTTTAGTAVTAALGTNGLSMAVPQFITTYAAQTTQTQASGNIAGTGYTSTTQAGSTVGVTNNTAGLSAAWPPFITTYVAQTTQTQPAGNIAGVGTTFAGTNVSGSMTLNTNGLNLALSVPAGGGAGDGYNSAQFTNSTANSTMPLVWAGNSGGSGNVTIGLTGSTITMSAPSGGGAADGGNVVAVVGSTAASTGTVVFSNSNNVTFGLNGATVTATATFAQSVQTQASGNIAGAGYTSTTQAGSTVGATHNSQGLSMAWPPFITTYAAQTTQTQASGNIVGAGFTSTTTAGSIPVATLNSLGLSMGVPQWLTTQSVQTQASGNIVGSGFTSTTTAGSVPTATHNSAGLSMGIPAWITTYVAQTTQTQPAGNIAGVGTTFGGTNVSGSMTLNSNGLALSLSAPTPGGGAAINVSAGTTSGNLQTIVFSNSNGVSFGLNGSTVTASAAGGGGGNTADTFYFAGNTTGTSSGTIAQSSLAMSGAGAMTVGYSNSSVVLSAPAMTSLAAGANITLSSAGSTISIIGPGAGGTISAWPDIGERIVAYSTINSGTTGNTGGSTQITASAYVASFPLGNYLAIKDIDLFAVATTAAGTGSNTNLIGIGIYTLNGGTALSLVSSFQHANVVSQNSQTAATINWWWGTNSTSNNSATNGGSNSIYSGTRRLELVDSAQTWSPGNYYVAVMHVGRSSSANVAPVSSIAFQSTGAGLPMSYFGTASTAVFGGFQGAFSTTTNVTGLLTAPIPSSIHTSVITQNSASFRIPFIYAYQDS